MPALKEFAPEERPNSTVVFWSFRLMAGLGMLMLLLGVLALWLRRGDRLYHSRPFLRFALWMGPSGLIAILAGWVTTEVGRQPGWCMAFSAPPMPFPLMAICICRSVY